MVEVVEVDGGKSLQKLEATKKTLFSNQSNQGLFQIMLPGMHQLFLVAM